MYVGAKKVTPHALAHAARGKMIGSGSIRACSKKNQNCSLLHDCMSIIMIVQLGCLSYTHATYMHAHLCVTTHDTCEIFSTLRSMHGCNKSGIYTVRDVALAHAAFSLLHAVQW